MQVNFGAIFSSPKYASVAVLAMLVGGCATLTENQTTQNYDPARDQSTLVPGPLQKANGPFPVGAKKFTNPTLQTISEDQCAGNSFLLRDLNIAKIGLSNRDVPGAAALLAMMGYTVMNPARNASQRIACNELPVVVQPGNEMGANVMPSPGVGEFSTGVIGDLTVRPLLSANTADVDHLLVFYHEEKRAELDILRQQIREKVDVPSPQVYIETMVLEVSEEDSKELGISYENANIGTNNQLNLGATVVNGGDTATFTRNTRTQNGVALFTPGTGIDLKIRALVNSGKAEVLSRPSVLALSNRQAVIQIVDVVQTPILQSSVGQFGELVISAYNFEPLLVGITLNLRPRVSDDRKWVSLEIDATVEAEVDENTGTAFAPDPAGGRIALADKQGLSSRKVRTFARIPDRTPIIIGGLVAGKKERQTTRVPVVGDIPYFGALFGATDNEVQKREVIIVLTPHVLAEDAIGIDSNRARGEVMARQSNLMLFNNSYRMQATDVFDMNFLMDDPKFRRYREKALTLSNEGIGLDSDHPARLFQTDRIPGERALVAKMLYDIVSNAPNRTAPDANDILVPELTNGSDINYTSLTDVLDMVEFGDDDREGLWFEIAYDGASGEYVHYHQVTRADNESWDYTEKMLTQGKPADVSTLLIRSDADRERLMRAIAADMVLRLNGGFQTLTMQNLKAGTVLQLGASADKKNYKLSARTFEFYNFSTSYFDHLQQELARSYVVLEAAHIIQ